MKRPKILWITDDQIDNKDIYKWSFSMFKLSLTLTEDFIFDDKYVLVLVDYGHLGDIKNAKILKRYYDREIPIIWTGGLGDTNYYLDDCKKTFPDELWMHTIKSFGLTDLKFWVNRELKDLHIIKQK